MSRDDIQTKRMDSTELLLSISQKSKGLKLLVGVHLAELEVDQKCKLLEAKIVEIQASREAYKISKKNLIDKTKGLLYFFN